MLNFGQTAANGTNTHEGLHVETKPGPPSMSSAHMTLSDIRTGFLP